MGVWVRGAWCAGRGQEEKEDLADLPTPSLVPFFCVLAKHSHTHTPYTHTSIHSLPRAPPMSSPSPLVQALALASNLLALQPPAAASGGRARTRGRGGAAASAAAVDPLLATEAHRLHAALGAWLASHPTLATTTTKKARTALHLLDLPAPILLHVFSFLVPRNPGDTRDWSRYRDHDEVWDDFGAFARTCQQLHAISEEDVLWEPACKEIWGSVASPALRALWRGAHGYAAVYRKMAQTTLCVEAGGYRER